MPPPSASAVPIRNIDPYIVRLLTYRASPVGRTMETPTTEPPRHWLETATWSACFLLRTGAQMARSRIGSAMGMEEKAQAAIEDRNRAAVERLRALGARLSDEELTRLIEPPWTAAALFAHVAFWDRFVHARWRLAASTGRGTPLPIDDAVQELVQELVNDASLQQWLLIPPQTAFQDCLAAAAEVDALIGSLKADVVSELVQGRRERLVDRSLHRREHLDTLETAFPHIAP
jgi:hypothetical protein